MKKDKLFIGLKLKSLSYWIWFEEENIIIKEDGSAKGKDGWGKDRDHIKYLYCSTSEIEGRIESSNLG